MLSSYKMTLGTIYKGPERQTNSSDINMVYVKVMVSNERAQIKGEPALFGGIVSLPSTEYDSQGQLVPLKEPQYDNGLWVPISLPSSEIARTCGWPKSGSQVIIYYTGTSVNDDFFAIPVQFTFSEESNTSVANMCCPIIPYMG
jgi:hypothetical protein